MFHNQGQSNQTPNCFRITKALVTPNTCAAIHVYFVFWWIDCICIDKLFECLVLKVYLFRNELYCQIISTLVDSCIICKHTTSPFFIQLKHDQHLIIPLLPELSETTRQFKFITAVKYLSLSLSLNMFIRFMTMITKRGKGRKHKRKTHENTGGGADSSII